MKIKYFLVIMLVVMMLVSLTACDSDSDKEKNDTDDTLGYLTSREDNRKENKNEANPDTSDNENNNIENTSDATKFLKQVKSLSSSDALANAEKQMAEPENGDTIAIFHIKDYGDITVKLFEDVAPKACENFIKHAKDGYYDGVIFHRVINEFMIQGGDPEGTGYGGESIWKKGFSEELNASILPYKGSLCMASGGTGTSSLGSQFFITQANYNSYITDYLKRYGISNLEESYKKYGGALADLVGYGQYTTFGQVIDGMDVVDKIASVSTNSKDKPLEDVIISNIEVTTYSE